MSETSNTLGTILVIVDPTANVHPAVEKAAILAQQCHARIELYACETKESRATRYATHLEKGGSTDFIADTRVLVDAIAQPLRDRGLDVSVEVETGDPLHAKLLERTKTTCADLVVKDTHHHSLAKRTFITNTDWHLIRGCPVPLLLTKPKPWPSAPVLMAGVDPGHVNDKPVVLDRRILGWSQALERRLGGRLHVVHAYLPMLLVAEAASGMPAMTTSLTPQMMEDERKRELARVEALIAPFGIAPANVHVELGTASDVLPRFAQEIGADVVVMGAISRSGLQRVFIGSTAERVLEHLPCDVCIVKPPDFAAVLPF
jgi:universal stress protein E